MNASKTLLTLDTALNGCSVGIFTGEAAHGYYEDRAMSRGQAEALLPMMERVREKAGIAYECIDGVAVTCGPGNFTGLRIALTAARTFARMRAIPAYGLSTTQCIAFAFCRSRQQGTGNPGMDMLVALDTKRGDYYTQLFSHDCTALEEPVIRTGPELYAVLDGRESTVLIGHGLDALTDRPAVSKDNMRPDPSIMAAMCFQGYAAAGSGEHLHPIYMRDAETNLAGHTK